MAWELTHDIRNSIGQQDPLLGQIEDFGLKGMKATGGLSSSMSNDNEFCISVEDVHPDSSRNIRAAWLSCFQQNASLHQFEEQPVERLFPELQQLPSKLVWVYEALFPPYLLLLDCVHWIVGLLGPSATCKPFFVSVCLSVSSFSRIIQFTVSYSQNLTQKIIVFTLWG